MESAIGQIQTRVTGVDRPYADERIRQLSTDLDGINRSVAATTNGLLATRQAEVERLEGSWITGDAPTRAEAARWVAEHGVRYGYIDDRIGPAMPAPVTSAELAEFAMLIRQVGVSRADACAAEIPDLDMLPAGTELSDRFAQLAQLGASVRSVQDVVRDWQLAVSAGSERLRHL